MKQRKENINNSKSQIEEDKLKADNYEQSQLY
jgi:hypothetical protein